MKAVGFDAFWEAFVVSLLIGMALTKLIGASKDNGGIVSLPDAKLVNGQI